MCTLFNPKNDANSGDLFEGLKSKSVKGYYFDTKDEEGVVATDISSLDVMDSDQIISEWGGLSSFASRASEIVSEYGTD